uniref:Lactosylceramide 4-alpha-galactosyltransferase n=1 Tax=Nicotiana tabacum TaxID=4097 RepID=A0A1S3WXK8_TOBAC|nr:PREDICTED: lactosylceramide 4-alpha-galactosyltransferase-like [Nicotiana tabacum]
MVKMFDYYRISRTKKFHLFSILSFALIVCIISFSDNLVSNLSISHSVVFVSKTNSQQPLKSTFVHKPLFYKKEEINEPSYIIKEEEQEQEQEEEDHVNLVAPYNLTEEERISWFRKKLPEFSILKSTRLSSQFNSRVNNFLITRSCSVQFFMTWISPASSFGRREFFALETLFKAHPKGCLIILSQTLDTSRGVKILRPLIQLGYKVLAVTPELSFLFNDTPVESWFDDLKNGKKDPGEIPLAQNLSNLIRLAVLYKYGGVYLDTDFIILKDVSRLRNSIGAQSIGANGKWTRLNNAVLIFDKEHPLLYKFMEEFAFSFNGNKWGQNGPYLVSRVVEKLMISTNRDEFNFTVLPPIAFYPVDWIRIAGFFMKFNSRSQSRWIEAKLLQLSGKTYGVHLWNRQSSSMKIEQGSIIGRLISDHCLLCKDIYSS